MNIGERIRSRRKELGITAETVADRLGVSPATVYRYENGDILKVPSSVLVKISEILQTSPGWLMGWTDAKDTPLYTAAEVRQIIDSHPVVSTSDWDPEDMDYADKENESIRIMTRGMKRMSPENRQKLLDMARVMFGEDFDEDGNKRAT